MPGVPGAGAGEEVTYGERGRVSAPRDLKGRAGSRKRPERFPRGAYATPLAKIWMVLTDCEHATKALRARAARRWVSELCDPNPEVRRVLPGARSETGLAPPYPAPPFLASPFPGPPFLAPPFLAAGRPTSAGRAAPTWDHRRNRVRRRRREPHLHNNCYSIHTGMGKPCAPGTYSFVERCRLGSHRRGLRTLPKIRRLPALPKPPNETVSCAVPLSHSHSQNGSNRRVVSGQTPGFSRWRAGSRKRPELEALGALTRPRSPFEMQLSANQSCASKGGPATKLEAKKKAHEDYLMGLASVTGFVDHPSIDGPSSTSSPQREPSGFGRVGISGLRRAACPRTF